MGAERREGAEAAPDVRLELTHGPDGPGVLADGRALPVASHGSPTEAGLAAARRHAARSGRDLRVEVVDGASVTVVTVSPHGTVTLVEPPGTGPVAACPPVPAEPVTVAGRTAVDLPVTTTRRASARPVPPVTTVTAAVTPASSAWASPPPAGRPRRPVSSLVVAGLVAVAVLVGAVGTGVATLSSSQALPGTCRPVTLYSVGGQGGSSDVLGAVTGPLAKQFGEKVSVVTVPPPPSGGSFASAESEAVGSLATAMGEHVEGCPTGALMLFGYSQGAQVAGDLASRIGTGLEPRIPAKLVQAVGLFGDPARSPRTRAVPDGTTGQGALPPRAVGFGSLDARTIEICAPGDPVCDSPTTAVSPPLEQAIASPVHGSYQQLPVATGTTAPQWAAASLGKVVAAIPTDAGPATTAGTAPQSGGDATTSTSGGTDTEVTTTPGSVDADTGTSTSSGTGSTGTGSTGTASTGTGTGTGTDGGATGATTAPGAGTGTSGTGSGTYEGGAASGDAGSAVTPTTAPSGSGATGGTGDGAGVSTRRSGEASASTGRGGAATADTDGTAGDTSAGGGSRGTSAGSGSSGQGSTGTSTSSGAGTTTTASGSGSGSYGTNSSGTVSSGQGSTGTSGTSTAAPTTTTGGSGSTTTSATPSRREGGSAGGSSGNSGTDKKDKKAEKGTATGAAWSLVDGLEGFKSTPWNNQNATDPSAAPSPNVPGRQAVKFEMPGGGKRTEAEPDVPEFTEGQKAFVGYSGFFDKGFPTNTDTWQVIMQFKQPGTGSPPLAVEVGKGQLRLANDGTGEKDFCPVTDGAFSFQLGITFGGAVDAWCNGQQTLNGFTTPKPNVQGSAYLKTGIYRDESIKQDSTLFLNDLKVGKTLDSVSGLAGVGGGSTGTTATGTTAPAPTPSTAPADGASTTTGATGTAPGSAASGSGTAGSGTAGSGSYGTGSAAGATGSGSYGTGPGGAPAEPAVASSASSVTAGPATAIPATAQAGAATATATPATAGTSSARKLCDKFGSTEVDGGRFLVQNNEWGASDGQCVTPTVQGFTVDSGNHEKKDAPAAYPSIMSGCWMGTCTRGTTLPTRISELGPITSSIAGTIPPGTRSNLAYDLWADSTPRRTGHNDALELMIWLEATGGIQPIGAKSGTATIGGATWDVWKGTNGGVNVLSYVRQGAVDRADALPLTDFVKDAVAQGSVRSTDFLTNIQAGFEPWTGGPGLTLTRFDVTDGAASAPSRG